MLERLLQFHDTRFRFPSIFTVSNKIRNSPVARPASPEAPEGPHPAATGMPCTPWLPYIFFYSVESQESRRPFTQCGPRDSLHFEHSSPDRY